MPYSKQISQPPPLGVVIDIHCTTSPGASIVPVGHSWGCIPGWVRLFDTVMYESPCWLPFAGRSHTPHAPSRSPSPPTVMEQDSHGPAQRPLSEMVHGPEFTVNSGVSALKCRGSMTWKPAMSVVTVPVRGSPCSTLTSTSRRVLSGSCQLS